METLSRDELFAKTKGLNWVFPYNELIATYDPKFGVVELVEDYAPKNGLFGEAWRSLHFPKTSPLVVGARREGTKTIFRLKQGKTELALKPSFAPIGIEEVKVEKDEIFITYSGLAGGGVSACYCRGLAAGVKRIEIIDEGGGNKFGRATIVLPRLERQIVSVDDTDTADEGATYALVHNIAEKMNCDKTRYFTHVNAQLFPENPNKTKNCMSTAVSFVSVPGKREEITKFFEKELKENTLSGETGMVVFEGIIMPEAVKEYAIRAKKCFLSSIGEVLEICKNNEITAIKVTGEKGLIGALAGLGMHDNPEFAAALPNVYEF